VDTVPELYEIRTFSTAANDREAIIRGVIHSDIPFSRLLEANAFNERHRSTEDPSAYTTTLKIAADDRVLKRIEIRCFDSRRGLTYPEAIYENIFGPHITPGADVNADTAAVKKHIEKHIRL